MNTIERGGIGMTSQRTRDRLIQRLMDQGITNQRVLNAIRDTPRHLFLDEALAHRAYEDTALPIGHKQTLSQPYIVARMTELLLEHEIPSQGQPQKVLEIGTGSGYQAAILAQLVGRVYTVERVRPLLLRARELLRRLGHRTVTAALSDGSFGWLDYAPYDAIISTAAPREVPRDLLRQLAPNGILVIPVGGDGEQELRVIVRDGESQNFTEEVAERVRFVPLLGGVTR